jgi:hypothetical protein
MKTMLLRAKTQEIGLSKSARRQVNKAVTGLLVLFAAAAHHAEAQIPAGGFEQPGVGAVVRTVQDKLADQVNVKDFGAKCDGSTDDSAAFQNAHNAIPYGTIIIPIGTCVINTNLNVTRDNIKWRGTGQGSTRLQMGPAVTKLFNVTNNSSQQLVLPEFSDMTVDGTLSPQGIAFYFSGARSIHIERVYTVKCYISYYLDRGLALTQTFNLSRFMIEDTPDLPGARGIVINGGGDAWMIADGRMFQNSQSKSNVGIELLSGGGYMVDKVDVSSYGRAFLVDPPANQYVRFGQFNALQCDTSWGDNATLDGTASFGSGYPYGIYDLHFVNSWFSSAGAYGGNGNGVNLVAARGIVIDTSQIYSNSLSGIRIQSASNHITVSNGQISGNSNGYGNMGTNTGVYSGITIDPGTDSFILTGNASGAINYSPNTQKYGISIGAGSVNYIVTGNNLDNNITGGYLDMSHSAQSQVALNLPIQY